MKPNVEQVGRRKAFTIIELLTVMSIIVILIGLLLPALSKVRRYATNLKQKAQLHSIDTAIELYRNECDGYPPSGARDNSGTTAYCGAMKLCEALMGQDLLGFHSSSVFRVDGYDVTGTTPLYQPLATTNNLSERMGPYLAPENANAYRMRQIYENPGSFRPETFVLCDVFERQMASGEKTGMPILYYKADTANALHDPNFPPTIDSSNGNIYNYTDNQELIELGKPWESGTTGTHAMAAIDRFYKNTRSHKIDTMSQPYRPDTYLLISAGYDGEYGTADDVVNFEWKYRP